MKLTRRGLLKGVGGLGLTLPWLEQLAPRVARAGDPVSFPKRVIVMTYEMGIPVGQWRPVGEGSTFTLPYVTQPLEPFKSRCLFVSDIDNRMLDLGGSAFQFGHPGKCEAALTGTLTTGAFPTNNTNAASEILGTVSSDGGANAESVEQRIGRFLKKNQPYFSVDLGIDGDRGTGKVASRFCFESRGTPVTLECDPTATFAKIFASVAPGDPQAEARLRELRTRNKSVLDAVRASFADLSRGLGADDRRRLEEHAARIRQIEIDGTIVTCAQPNGIVALTKPRMDQAAAPQIKMLAQAMACDLAPVGRIEFANQQNPRFGVGTLDSTLDTASAATGYDWHGMVHGEPLPGTAANAYLRPGRDPSVTTYDNRLMDGYRFFVQQFANLLTELDSFPEGQGTTVLDNSLVVLATDFGDGLGHYHGKMGYVMAGNLGGAKKGFHLRGTPAPADFYTPSTYDVSQLLNSIVDMAGVTSPGEFGLQGYAAKAGKPRRIDALFA